MLRAARVSPALLALLAMMGVAIGRPAAAETANAAHLLAQKFAGATQTAPDTPAPGAAPATSPKAAPKSATAPSNTPAAARLRPSRDYEDDMLARARAERDAERAADAQANAAKAKAGAKASSPVSQALPLTTSKIEATAPEPARVAGAAAATTTPAAPAATAPHPTASAAATEAKAVNPSAAAPSVTPGSGKPVTLLLAIELGGASKMAEIFRSLDLILCAGQTCFISKGLDDDAATLPRSEALRHRGKDEHGANACRGMAGCVFRNVALPDGAPLKLVSVGSGIRIESHAFAATPDRTCDASGGALNCDNPIATTDFRIWVVPETLAERAGVELLENAVADGLQQANYERTSDK